MWKINSGYDNGWADITITVQLFLARYAQKTPYSTTSMCDT